jgi:hypothetical protein
VPGEHPHAACLGLVGDFGNKPRLADACLTGDER